MGSSAESESTGDKAPALHVALHGPLNTRCDPHQKTQRTASHAKKYFLYTNPFEYASQLKF